MPKLLISQFIDKSGTFEEKVPNFEGIPVQIGFFEPTTFFGYEHRDLVQRCKDFHVPIESIHAPTIDIFQENDFFRMLDMVRENYGVDNITIHPGSGNPFMASKLFERHHQRIRDSGIYLLYENFDSSKNNKRWLPSAKNIYTVPIEGIFLTYDTSHVSLGTDIVQDLSCFLPRLGMVHLSNRKKRKKHLPVFEGDHDLRPVIEYLRNYPAFVTLEYYNNDLKLLKDYNYLSGVFSV